MKVFLREAQAFKAGDFWKIGNTKKSSTLGVA